MRRKNRNSQNEPGMSAGINKIENRDNRDGKSLAEGGFAVNPQHFGPPLNVTDVYSGWTESRAGLGRGQAAVVQALEEIAQALPFRWLGIEIMARTFSRGTCGPA